MKIQKGPLLYAIALLVGIISEFVGFQMEQWMILTGVPANIGFPVSLLVFIVFPFHTTGVITYYTTREYFAAAILSTMVMPATVALINYLGI
ncbi:MAG: hypothetical protein ACE5G7_02620 [Candidatus Hydrothermarchaeaceae archaeon]